MPAKLGTGWATMPLMLLKWLSCSRAGESGLGVRDALTNRRVSDAGKARDQTGRNALNATKAGFLFAGRGKRAGRATL